MDFVTKLFQYVDEKDDNYDLIVVTINWLTKMI